MVTGERPFTKGKLLIDDEELFDQVMKTSDVLVEQTRQDLLRNRAEVLTRYKPGSVESRMATQAVSGFFFLTDMQAKSAVDTQVADLSLEKKAAFFASYMDGVTGLAVASLYRPAVESYGVKSELMDLTHAYAQARLSSYALHIGDERLSDIRSAQQLRARGKALPVASIEDGRDEVISAITEPIYTVFDQASIGAIEAVDGVAA